MRRVDPHEQFVETRERHRKAAARAEWCSWIFAGLMVAVFLVGVRGVLSAAGNYVDCREADHEALLCLEHAVLGRALPGEGGER